MHFRVRGQNLQVLRTVYATERKTSRTKVVCRIPKSNLKIPADVVDSLTEDERSELEYFLSTYRNTQILRQKLSAHQLPEIISEVVDYYNHIGDSVEKDIIRSFMAQAALDLRRAGGEVTD